ncbi:hypothetical protein [Thioflexithrix psekupsensis]|uniref:Uncharacterized protein n=1 Tax=Thioflexithrix psekupsensis TaxID=1570016 RepID=A0A251XCK7_9GAMM|nr:hypothetical protein [Thioflexithrix psekupsensis]OUD16172.1 hypothetical protein TPSD3_00135 [Thioflexithrix psekupsensis]
MKKKLLTFLIALSCYSGVSMAAEVNFSRAYIIQSTPEELLLGNVEHWPNLNPFPFTTTLKLGFDRVSGQFLILESQPQVLTGDLLQAQLQNTLWKGEYKTVGNFYITSLNFLSVNKGFVGAEVIHDTGSPNRDNYLRAHLGGTIFSEYLIKNQKDEEEWLSQVAYLENVARIEEANAKAIADLIEKEKDPSEAKLEVIPPIIAIRHQVRLKRVRGLEFRHSSASWGSATEYRFTIENNEIKGIVGTPRDSYSSNDGTTGNGNLWLIPAAIYDERNAPPVLE